MKKDMKKITLTTLGFVLIIMAFSSCSSIKLLPADVSNKAKNLKIPDNKALVYIFRKSSLGAAIGLSVDINNKELAKFYPKKFYLCVLEPGKYLFTGHGENEDEIIVTLEQGKKYYIEVLPKMGFAIARCKLELVTPLEGNAKVQKCKLIGLNSDARTALNYTLPIK